MRLNHPSSVLRKWKTATAVPKPPGEKRPTLRDSVASLSEDKTRLETEIAQLKEHIVEIEAASEIDPKDDARNEFITALSEKSRQEQVAVLRGVLHDLRLTTSDLAGSPAEEEQQKPAPQAPVDDGTGIPEFLRRGPSTSAPAAERQAELAVITPTHQEPANNKDKLAADEIRPKQEEQRKRKARNRIETMKAKKSGATDRMPLEGKAALAAIKRQKKEMALRARAASDAK
jgi:hypothetical protein